MRVGKRTKAVLGAAIVAAAGFFFLLLFGTGRGAREHAAGPTPPTDAGGSDLPVATTSRQETREQANSRIDLLGTDTPMLAEGGIELGGVFEPLPPDRVSGRLLFRPTATAQSESDEVEATVQNGRWSASLRSDSGYLVQSALIRGVRAVPDPPDQVVTSAGADVRLALCGRTTLHVVHAETGHDLTGVLVATPSSWPQAEQLVPPLSAQKNLLISDGSSPVQLPDIDEPAAYWIGASGFERRRITIGKNQLEAWCELAEAGELSLEIPIEAQGLPSEFYALLGRAMEGDGVEWLTMAFLSGPGARLTWSGLRPGNYSVLLGSGNGRHLSLKRIGERPMASVDWGVELSSQVTSGARTVLTGPMQLPWAERASKIVVRALVPTELRESVETEIQLRLSVRGGSARPALVLRPGDAALSEDGLAWRVAVVAQPYEIELEPFGLTAKLDCRSGAEAETEFDLGRLSRLIFHVVDEADEVLACGGMIEGRPVGTPGVEWRSIARLGGVASDAKVSLVRKGAWEFRFLGSGYESDITRFDVPGDVHELLLAAKPVPSTSVELELVSSGDEVVVPWSWFEGLVVEDSNGSSIRFRFLPMDARSASRYGYCLDVSSVRMELSGLGPYTFRFPDAEGYELPTRMEWGGTVGGPTRLKLELTRR